LYKKPELGAKPAFLSKEEGALAITASSQLKRALDALRHNRDYAIPATVEYFSKLSEELEKLRIEVNADPFDDYVVKSIESFFPHRNEVIGLILNLAIYRDTLETRTTVHRFFEQLIPYLDWPKYRDWDVDNFKFIVHELFLYAVACLIKTERFESAAYLMSNDYYVPGRSERGIDVMAPFNVFRQHMKSLERRNERLNLRRLSVRADLLDQRCKGTGIDFRHLMQADFILFLRDHLDRPKANWHWRPETLLFASWRHSGAFEVFARSRSSRYFEQAKILLGIDAKDQLQPLLEAFSENRRSLPRWDDQSFSPSHLLGFNEIATKP